MSQISKVAVVAGDHSGNWHVDKCANAAAGELMAMVDAHFDNTNSPAQKRVVVACNVYREAILPEDAISQTPSIRLHYKIVRAFLKATIDQMRNILIPKESLKTKIIAFIRGILSTVIEPGRNQLMPVGYLMAGCRA